MIEDDSEAIYERNLLDPYIVTIFQGAHSCNSLSRFFPYLAFKRRLTTFIKSSGFPLPLSRANNLDRASTVKTVPVVP